jgi:hypothetical protein
MRDPPETGGREQRLLRHARREGLVIMSAWAVALLWSVGVSYLFGYGREARAIGLVLGMPDWVFWGVAFPWGLCLLLSVWFCFRYMADDDLGQDREGPGHE